MTRLAATWQSAKVVRTRDKVSFFCGVMSLLLSALLFGLAPQSVPVLPPDILAHPDVLDGCMLRIR